MIEKLKSLAESNEVAFLFAEQIPLTWSEWYQAASSLSEKILYEFPKPIGIGISMEWNRECLINLAAACLLKYPVFIYKGEIPEELIPDFGLRIEKKEGIKNTNAPSLPSFSFPTLALISSGTSGAPKIWVHNLDELWRKYEKLKTPYRVFTAFSADHISGIEAMASALSPGGTLSVLPAFSPGEAIEKMRNDRIQIISGTPTLIRLLLLNGWTPHPELKIIQCGGESMDIKTRDFLTKKFNQVQLFIGYGTTETANIRTFSNEHGIQLGKLNSDFRIENEMLWVKNGPSRLGNWEQLKSGKFLKEEWINTGDMVSLDEHGNLVFGKRKDHIVNVGGEKINTKEVEVFLTKRPEILTAQVKGISNLMMGQILEARLVLYPFPDDKEVYRKELRTWLQQHLPSFKIPQKIILLEEPEYSWRGKQL